MNIFNSSEALNLSLASEADTQAINELLSPRSFSITEDDWGKSQYTLKVARQSGELVAACCFGVVNNQDELNDRLGNDVPWDSTTFPVATITKICTRRGTLYDRPLKFISLFFADHMRMLALAGETEQGLGAFVISQKRFQALLEWTYAGIACGIEWQGDLPFPNLLPNLNELGPMSEYIRKSMT